MSDLLRLTDNGLFCEAGGFYIDPWGAVDRAVITHAHSDHARAGSRRYLASREGVRVLRERVQSDAAIDGVPYGETIALGETKVSLHPAGHLLGSAQVRVEHKGDVWVVTGDYKVEPDSTCAGFEAVRCNTFLTESTFALPIYRWQSSERIFGQINEWWRANQADGRTSVVFAYALGKAQRVLSGLDASIGPILVHGSVDRFVKAYREAGVALPRTEHANDDNAKATCGRALVIAPESAAGTTWIRKFGEVSTGVASGWMQLRGARRRRNVDRGFVLSDHADWPGLLGAIDATGAERVLITHGYSHTLERYLRENGKDAHALQTRFSNQGEEASEEASTEG